MSQRVHLPAGHNDTTARFARQASGLCNAQEACAIEIERVSLTRYAAEMVAATLFALALALAVLLLPGCQMSDAAIERAMQADAQEALQELAEAQRIERIAALVDASARGQ